MADGKGSDEVPVPAVLQLPVHDEAIASGSEVVAEASGLQDVALSDSEEVTLFERSLKSSHKSSQGEKKCLSGTFLQPKRGLRCSLQVM